MFNMGKNNQSCGIPKFHFRCEKLHCYWDTNIILSGLLRALIGGGEENPAAFCAAWAVATIAQSTTTIHVMLAVLETIVFKAFTPISNNHPYLWARKSSRKKKKEKKSDEANKNDPLLLNGLNIFLFIQESPPLTQSLYEQAYWHLEFMQVLRYLLIETLVL